MVVLVVVVLQSTAHTPAGIGPVVVLPSTASPTDTGLLPTGLLPTGPLPTGPLPTGSVSAAPTATDAGTFADVPVRVLNYSRRTGLAHRVAQDLERAGWRVVEVGNARHRTTESTVFYSPGRAAAAAALRRQFPAIRAAAPAPPDVPGDGLTLIVTRDWPP